MSEPERLPRLYDEKEIGKLLERATQIQREEPVRAAASGGMSLRELEEIGGEAGIDPRHLRRAALELDSGQMEPSGWARFLGAPPTAIAEAWIDGELPVERFERLVPTIQQVTRAGGQPSQIGRTLTWRAVLGRRNRALLVTVTSRDGQTHVRAEEHLSELATGIFAGGMGGMGMGMGVGVGAGIGGALGSALFAVAFPVGTVGLAYLGGREIYTRLFKRRHRLLTGLVDRLSREIGDELASGS